MDSTIHTPRISHDLVRPVFEYLQSDKTSLCVVSLASSAFRDEAQRILFRNVNPTTYTSHIKFLRMVAASPTRLALFVRAYRQWWTYPTLSIEEVMKSLTTVVADGLKAMRCLKRLDILLYAGPISACHPAYIQILSECTFSLERFVWDVQSSTSDELVEKFLARQSTLRHLRLMHDASLADKLGFIPATICPRLSSAELSWDMLKAFLPGHNISTLMAKGWAKAIPDAIMKSFAVELKRVKVFSISFSSLTEAKMLEHGILRYFPSLIVLEFYFIHYYDEVHDDEDECTPLKKAELDSLLSELPALERLILSSCLEERDREEDVKLTRHVFENFGKHLKCIDIDMCGTGLYTRYTQSCEIVQEISMEEVRKMWGLCREYVF